MGDELNRLGFFAAAAFGSKEEYFTGRFSAFLKLPCGNTSGTVFAFYVSKLHSKLGIKLCLSLEIVIRRGAYFVQSFCVLAKHPLLDCTYLNNCPVFFSIGMINHIANFTSMLEFRLINYGSFPLM